jgi:uncharacterized membrane protein YdjX (TVP38/TMEM64 family)
VPAVRATLARFIGVMRAGGLPGALALVGFDTAWALLSAPYWVMGAICGYAFGFPFGIVVAMPAATLGMSAAFTAGKALLPRLMPDKDVASPRVAAVRRAIDANGFKVALLLRMTPLLPQNVLTYVLSTTRLRTWELAVATAVGLAPLTLFYVYLGSVVDDAAALLSGDAPDVGPGRWIVLGGGLVVGAVALYVIGRIARGALARAMAEGRAEAPRHPAAP